MNKRRVNEDPRKVSVRASRALVRIARQGKVTARMVLQKSGLDVSLRTVQCILFEDTGSPELNQLNEG